MNIRTPMTPREPELDKMIGLEIKDACAALCHAFDYYLDRRDYESVASLFTDDGVWIRYGTPLQGREALLAAFRQRSLRQQTRHLVTNIHFTEVEHDMCRAVATVVVFFNSDAEQIPAILPTDSIAVMDFHDTYARTPSGWRITERDTRPILVPGPMLAAMTGER